jgi:hypothetical protein
MRRFPAEAQLDRARGPRGGRTLPGFWLEAREDVLEERVAARAGDASDADLAVVRAQRARVRGDAVIWARVRADRPPAELAGDVLSRLGEELALAMPSCMLMAAYRASAGRSDSDRTGHRREHSTHQRCL